MSFYKKGETSPANRITVWGGYRDVPQPHRRGDRSPPQTKREFQFSAPDSSEEFGGQFRLNLEQEAGALKGTLSLAKRGEKTEEMAITLSPKETSPADATTNATPAAEAKVNPNDLTGVYDGVLTAEKRQFFAKLRLNREAANQLSGELIFSATATDRVPLGSFKLKGTFDPAKNTFELSSGGELTSSDGLILATANGEFEPSSGKIRAQLTPSAGTLDLTRNEGKTAELQAQVAGTAKRLAQGPVSLAQARSDDERRDAIVRWFRRLKQEYPDLDLHHSILGPELYGKVLNLFCDDEFVPVFGKPFDAMSMDDRNYVKQLLRRLFSGPGNRDLLDGFGDFLERPFVLPRGSFSYADVAPQVAFRRSVFKKWEQTMTRLKALPATSAGFDEILALKQEGEKAFPDLWPSQLRQFREAVEAARHRVAEGALVERLQAAQSQATSYDGLVKLMDTVSRNQELFALVPEQVSKREMAQVQEKIETELTLLMAGERQKIDAFGSGAAALANGTQWLRDFHSKYQERFKSSPAISDTKNYLDQRRIRDLEAGENEVESQLATAPTAEAVRGVLGQYLGADRDQATEPGKRIRSAADKRLRAIAWEKEKTKYSERELALMNKDSPGMISVPSNYEPPSAQEIILATLRAYASTGGEVVNANTATSTPLGKKLAYRIQIQNVELTNLEHPGQNPCQPDEAGGYVCQYRLSMTVRIPNLAGSSQDPILKLNERLIDASEQAQKQNEPQLKKVRFVLTTKGWRAPQLESEVASLSLDLR